MAQLTVTAANVSADVNQNSTIRNYKTGGTVNVGDVVYADSSDLVYQAVGNILIANARAIGIVVNTQSLYGDTSAGTGKYVSVCVAGPVNGFSGLTGGVNGWIDKTTAGKLNDTAPTGGAFQYALGHAIDSVTFFVDPGETAPVSA